MPVSVFSVNKELSLPTLSIELPAQTLWGVDEAAMPTLKVAKTLWGVDEATDTGKWDALFARIASEGFDGVEVIAPTWRADPALLTSLLTKHGLALICQLHTTGGDIVGGEYVYCSSCKLDDHVASFEALATT